MCVRVCKLLLQRLAPYLLIFFQVPLKEEMRGKECDIRRNVSMRWCGNETKHVESGVASSAAVVERYEICYECVCVCVCECD